jgi:hypothetical protein
MKKILHTLKICSLFLLFSVSGCDDDNPNPNNYGVYPMDLKVEPLANGGYRYSWNKINSSDFISYTLVLSSTDTVPYVLNPNLLPTTSSPIQVIIDPTITSFTDVSSLPSGNPHVRLFAFLEGRSLSSTNKKLTPIDNLKELNIQPLEFAYSEKKKKLMIFSPSSPNFTNGSLNNTVINFINSDNLTTTNGVIPVTLTRTGEVYVGEFTLGTTLFVPNGNGFNYNLVNLDNPTNLNFLGTNNNSIITFKSSTTNAWWSVTSNISNINTSPAIFIPNTTSSTVQPLPITTATANNSYLLKMKNDNRTFLALKPNFDGANTMRAFFYEFLNEGKLQLLKTSPPALKTNTTFSKSTPFAFTKDDAYFMFDTKGLVFSSTDFSKFKTLAEEVPVGDNINYLEFVLNTEGNKIYALRSALTDKNNRIIDVFTYPNFKHERSIPYKSTPSKLILNSTHILLVGISPNNSRATMFEKIPF